MFYTVEDAPTHRVEAKVSESLDITTQILAFDDKRLHIFHRMHRAQ